MQLRQLRSPRGLHLEPIRALSCECGENQGPENGRVSTVGTPDYPNTYASGGHGRASVHQGAELANSDSVELDHVKRGTRILVRQPDR